HRVRPHRSVRHQVGGVHRDALPAEAPVDWDKGAFSGGHRAFHRAIVSRMPATQSPNLHLSGHPAPSFLAQRPFTV
ncbi:hypothetical protein AB0B42_29595, partial [Streptomyces fradiae]